MAQNFLEYRREQAYLMAPSLRDWLAEDHLAWFVIQTVEQLELAAFYAAYREDGHGRAAYEPAIMVSLVLYAYATKERSSRGIERHCRENIAYRVITARIWFLITRRSRGLSNVTRRRWVSCFRRCWGCARRQGW
jgi:transposase